MAFSVSFLAVGCKEVLYHDLSEREINHAVSILRKYCIFAGKESAAGGVYNLIVGSEDFTKAVMVLRSVALPARQYDNLGKLFQPSGLVPTPFEEKVRYSYGLSQEVEQTLSLMEGVLVVRAHVAMDVSSEGSNKKNDDSSRVSVYIRYDDTYDVHSLVPQIKQVVSDSVYNVNYDGVVVLALPSTEGKPSRSKKATFVCEIDDLWPTWAIIGGGSFIALLIVIALFLLWRRRSSSLASSTFQPSPNLSSIDAVSSKEAKDETSEEEDAKHKK